MIAPVYGSWCSYKTAESEAVTKDRAALEILCGSLLRHRRTNGEGSSLRAGGAIPEVSVLCEFADSGTRLPEMWVLASVLHSPVDALSLSVLLGSLHAFKPGSHQSPPP